MQDSQQGDLSYHLSDFSIAPFAAYLFPSTGSVYATSAGVTSVFVRTYVNNDGSKTVLTGGSRAWRDNNPGNLIFSTAQGAYNSGAIGVDQVGSKAFEGIYSSWQAGDVIQLQTLLNNWQTKTIDQTIQSYAPQLENNTVTYQAFIRNSLGVAGGSVTLGSLNNSQLTQMQDLIRQKEGWAPGVLSGAADNMGSPPGVLANQATYNDPNGINVQYATNNGTFQINYVDAKTGALVFGTTYNINGSESFIGTNGQTIDSWLNNGAAQTSYIQYFNPYAGVTELDSSWNAIDGTGFNLTVS